MARNVGSADKPFRLILGIALGSWAFLGMGFGSTQSYIVLAIGAILITTALINFCPLFKIFGISTSKANN